jgi:hypothetical protein
MVILLGTRFASLATLVFAMVTGSCMLLRVVCLVRVWEWRLGTTCDVFDESDKIRAYMARNGKRQLLYIL